MSELRDYPKIEFLSRQEIRAWLKVNHAKATTFWLVTYKKHVPKHHIPYGDVVEELLCYGWIDSRTRRLDEDHMMLLVAPRKAGSTWSASNKKRVARLTKRGLMTKAGQDKIEAAKQDGSWTFLDEIENLVVPDDLSQAFNKNKRARENFSAFNASARKVILLWIKTAKRDETRLKRVSETVRLAAKNLKAAHPEARGR
jgi:uncharacterized protein YdeI (YjbR/CyaY-like superfamily)